MFRWKGKLFCEINPTCYMISEKKEILKRHIKNLGDRRRYASELSAEKLPCLVSSYSNVLIKTGPGIDPVLQQNKAVNINLACQTMNGIIIHPGETFSFWGRIGNITAKKGYKDGRVIVGDKIEPGIGGGLCNLSNTIHRIVLDSPLDVVEFHNHSDALAPDHGKREPFSSGTSVCYNYMDYRFQNNTDQDFQLCAWCDEEKLYAELRCRTEIPYRYELVEEDHHFHKEGDKFYRISKIYSNTIDKASGEIIEKKLVLDNHSEVMFDYDLIPKDQIR